MKISKMYIMNYLMKLLHDITKSRAERIVVLIITMKSLHICILILSLIRRKVRGGLDTRVSLKQALSALGFKGGTRRETELNQWVAAEKKQLAAVMERHGIEWEQKGTHEKHLPVLDFEKQERPKEVASLEKAISGGKEELQDIQIQQTKAVHETIRCLWLGSNSCFCTTMARWKV